MRFFVRTRGFTIIELLITVVIVSILACAVFPMAELTIKRNKEQELRRQLREIREAIDSYKKAYDDGKIARRAGESGYPPSLQVLVEGVPDASSNAGRRLFFLRKLPVNPCAQKDLPAVEGWGKRSYASSGDNPKEGADIFDIFPNCSGNAMNGTPYREW